MVEMLTQEQLLPLCTALAQQIPNSIVGDHDFRPDPSGYSVLVAYKNDRHQANEAAPRMVM